MSQTKKQKIFIDYDIEHSVEHESEAVKKQKIVHNDEKNEHSDEEAEQWLKITMPILKKMCIDDVEHEVFIEQLKLLKVNICII